MNRTNVIAREMPLQSSADYLQSVIGNVLGFAQEIGEHFVFQFRCAQSTHEAGEYCFEDLRLNVELLRDPVVKNALFFCQGPYR